MGVGRGGQRYQEWHEALFGDYGRRAGGAVSGRLEDLEPGRRVLGLAPDGAAEILSVTRHYADAVQVVYRDPKGALRERLLYRRDEAALELVAQDGAHDGVVAAFDGDGALFRLVSEAMRIRLAHLFDPYLAVHTSRIEPLPHQITAVYGEMLPRQPLRFLLADDPGAGKTIMTGLLMKELLVRGDLERCLVVAPGNLVEQWQDELASKFGLSFAILSRERAEVSRSGNPFEDEPFLIARLDTLSRNEDLQARLIGSSPYDLVVVDEAHKMSASYTGGEVRYTKRYGLGEVLRERARHFLLLSATPHSGKREDFELFMALLDEDRFEGRARGGTGARRSDAGDLMRRLVKEELYTFEGRPLFPERRAYTVNYELTPEESALYEEVTGYVREEMNRAERFVEGGGGDDRSRAVNVGFALQILQRRLASSPEAIYSSLTRRRERLEARLADESAAAARGTQGTLFAGVAGDARGANPIPGHLVAEDLDDAPASEFEEEEERILDRATAAATVAELRAEIATLRILEERARRVRNAGTDTKWNELAAILDDPLMADAEEGRRKLIVFTEARDTLHYLADRIRTLRGRHEEVVEVHGGLSREERKAAVAAFTHDPSVLFMVATDAAGEGVNLQRAHLMVNYDLPWNPNRLEQRFGRIHRIGQREVCHLWNLVASGTREGEVYSRLLEKLEREREDLGGRVYDVLGRLFEARPLRELLVEAIRYGERPEVRARLGQSVEEAVDRRQLEELLEERALAKETMDPGRVEEVRERMERAEARRLQPHFVRSFFLEAFASLGGAARPREAGLYEIKRVPQAVFQREKRSGRGVPVQRAYDRVFFEKEKGEGLPPDAFVAPGHPLLEATIDLVIERHGDLLKRGAVLVDESDPGEEVRALFCLEHSLHDGRVGKNGEQQVISRRLQFVETDPKGGAFRDGGFAPYLDYRPLRGEERGPVEEALRAPGLRAEVESAVVGYTVRELVPPHVREVAERRLPEIERVEREVEARLKAQINYWDRRAEELKDQERRGKRTRLSSANARATAEELAGRLGRRREVLTQERRIGALPPVVRGAALVVPGGLLRRLARPGEADHPDPDVARRREIELLAMDAVMTAERTLGRSPKDVSDTRGIGYDVESKDPETGSLIFVEVKGKWEGKDDVVLTKNEILCSRNEPEKFRLAIVVVGEGGPRPPRYLVGHHFGEPDFEETARTFSLRKLLDAAGEPT